MRHAILVVLVLTVAACSSTRVDDGTSSSTTTARPAPDAQDCAGTGVAARRAASYLEESAEGSDLTTLEVISPIVPEDCSPVPAMVWVHGGGWRTGDRRNQLEQKVELFTSMGWALVSVNYRLVPDVRYPTFDEDVGAAIGWVSDHAAELGIDPTRISAMGHSAGAGIVAAVATDPAHLEQVGRTPSDLRCVVLLDTEGYDVEARASAGVQLYLDAFGTDPAIWRDASPLRHVSADTGIPRSLVVTRGSPRRRAISEDFVAALRSADVEAELLDAGPLTHAEVNAAVGDEADEIVTPVLVEFLRRC